jgi:hypothetical protein
MLKILLIISSFLFSTVSFACRGSFAEFTVLIEGALPSAANDEMVVAKVQLIAHKGQSGTVRVVQAIKGVDIGYQFEVQAGESSCSRLIRSREIPLVAQTEPLYFIAGNWKNILDKKVFVGEWVDGRRMNR